eukprot:CAMPEP_0117660358 /NCGR_PEP_ID=MMETSP0804-20121206/6926_1 /TAXON_ID=1074897 /ORGANISM="Tetraselmis astigmatica, Strain CCMP880" /LENGTH=351 /DNA_ID=CAMNT_0005467083 /DNA_START=178 /DNA_END=1233 /DNA_ORIENTATION=+
MIALLASSPRDSVTRIPLMLLVVATAIQVSASEPGRHAVVSGIFGPNEPGKHSRYVTEAMALAGSLIHHDVKADRVLLVTREVWEIMSELEKGRIQKLWTIEFTELLACKVNEAALFSIFPRHVAERNRQSYPVTCTKLQLFNLVQYSKVLWMDTDTIALANIGSLFQWPAKYAAAADPCTQYMFNAGVVLAAPDTSTYMGLKELALGEGSFDGGDQGVVNIYFGAQWQRSSAGDNRSVTRLPQAYNAPPSLGATWDGMGRVMGHLLEARGLAAGLLMENKVIHFMGQSEKPGAVLEPVMELLASDVKAAYRLLHQRTSNSAVYEKWMEYLVLALRMASTAEASGQRRGEL